MDMLQRAMLCASLTIFFGCENASSGGSAATGGASSQGGAGPGGAGGDGGEPMITYAIRKTPFSIVASFVMSHVQTWFGAVAVRDGIACTCGRRWFRRSFVSPASASTRYIVRIEAR